MLLKQPFVWVALQLFIDFYQSLCKIILVFFCYCCEPSAIIVVWLTDVFMCLFLLLSGFVPSLVGVTGAAFCRRMPTSRTPGLEGFSDMGLLFATLPGFPVSMSEARRVRECSGE